MRKKRNVTKLLKPDAIKLARGFLVGYGAIIKDLLADKYADIAQE